MTPAVHNRLRLAPEPVALEPAYLILDTESVPDGRLLAAVKYGDEDLTPQEAVRRAQEEAREQSFSGSDFLPVTFQFPIAICVIRVASDYTLQNINRLGEPHFQPRQMVEQFWNGLAKVKQKYKDRVKLVSFNGRGFDLPLLELAAFRYGCAARDHFQARNRYSGGHIDVMDWMSNFGALRMNGGLNVLAKLLGKPGKMTMTGDQVYEMYLEEKIATINDYCMFDTLDTYFIFLRTRVMTGELTLEEEHRLSLQAKEFIQGRIEQYPALRQYVANWGEWQPWP
jgi:predicted PolB exonuclease-like 3'-5' exonuclease